MNRRAFLQVAGGMIVGAMVGGNAPNPVVFPARPYNNKTEMPTQIAYEWGEQTARNFMAGFGELTIGSDAKRYIPVDVAEIDGEWEVVFVAIEG